METPVLSSTPAMYRRGWTGIPTDDSSSWRWSDGACCVLAAEAEVVADLSPGP
jgi:hypothetical protein